ncbi:Protein transport protein sec71 [Entophlyctis luteolus]|nr:Protein transport protein sec71 [Entophlyctis luteolus]
MLSAEHGRGTAAGGETLSETVVAIAAALDRLLAVASASSSKDCKDVCDSIAAAKALIAADSLPKFSDGVESADPVWPAFRAALAPALPAKLREAALDCLQKLIAIRCLRGASRIDSIASRAAHSASSASATAASPSGPANSTQSAAGSDYVGYLLSIVSFKPAVAAAPPHEDSQHANSEFDVSSPRLSSPGPQPPSSNSQASPSNHPASADNVPKPKQQNLFLIDEIVHFVCICFSSATPSTTALYLNSELYSAESSVHLQVLKVLLTAVTSSSTCQVHSTSLLKAVQTCFNIYLNSKSGGYSATAKASLTQIVHAVFSRMERYARLKAIESSEETAATRRDSDGIHNAGSSPAQPSTTRVVGMLEDDEPSVATTRDSMDEISGSSSSYFQSSKKVAGYENTVEYFNNLLRKDAFLVFRLLCRLSVQNESGSSASNSSAVLRSDGSAVVADDISSHTVKIRTLALEMMLSILTNAGPVVLTHEVFADLVKTMVVASVSRNAVATNLELFEFSLAIFLMLIRWYRGRIKMEIEVLLNTVYLHIVEMPNSTPSQKSMILESLYKICNDAQTIVDLYLNYDSDFHCASIYERILTICTRAAQQNLSHSTAPVSDGSIMGFVGAASGVSLATSLELRGRARMRLWGVRCLVAIVDSLVVWSRVGDYAAPSVSRFEPDPRTSTSSQKISVDAAHREDFGEHKVILNTRLRTVAIGSTAQNITPGAKGAAAVVLTPGAGGSGSGTPSIASDTGADEQQMQRDNIALVAHRKNLLREGLKLFVDKPIKAIDFFKKNGFIPKFAGEDEDDDVQTVAAFLKNTSGLSKAGIGSYLGEIDPFCVKVMHAFVDTLDFTGVGFVEALRMFLQTFRLPGEAQKIDRLMEKFADRYCENNPDVFAKADTAYTLAFSVIMLNTDLHSAHIKNRMDKPAFLKNNRGINDNSDLPDEYLEKIFDNIYENEIIMEDEQTNKFAQMVHGWGGTELSDKEKMDLWRKETAQIQKKSQQLISSANNAEKSPFRAAVQPDIAKPMFATACWPLIAVFSQTFESYSGNDALFEDDVDLSTGEHVNAVDLCLDGFAGGIKISAVFEMEMEREAFVTSLSKLTGLSHFRDFKPKNVKAIRTLLGLTLRLVN